MNSEFEHELNDTRAPILTGPAHRLFGDGELAELTRRLDWGATPLGPIEDWPQSLRTIVDTLLCSRFSMWVGWGPELRFFYNDAYRRDTIGVKHPWALGRPFREVWSEIWRDLEPRIRGVLETGQATWDEGLLLFLERSGYAEETYHTFSYSPLRDDDGKIAGLLSVVTEVTERVISDRRLSLLRELSSRLATSTSESDVWSAVESALRVNPHDLPFTAVYEYRDAGVAARRVCATGFDAEHPSLPPQLDPMADGASAAFRLAAFGQVGTVDVSQVESLPTGAWARPPTRAALVPIAQRASGTPAGCLIVGLNPYRAYDHEYEGFLNLVAGQIGASLANARAYDEERRRAEMLAELDRAKTTFFSNVSHEFRTPLTLLLGPLEDALTRVGAEPGLRSELELAHRNARRLLRLVNSLLAFSRIEAGRVEARYEPTDLAACTAELASSFRSACERAGIELVVETNPLDQPVYVDHDMWEKVVLNLLSNAFKHTFVGRITVSVREHGGAAEVTVADTGIGIAADELPRVFDRFHRVPNARSRTHEGTGIGLALVQEIVRRHGGRISVASRVGEGTAFTIVLPFGAAHLPREQVSGAGEQPARSLAGGAADLVEEALRWLPDSNDGRGAEAPPTAIAGAPESLDGVQARILLADDNADMREYVARLLRAQGWSVEAAPDGRAALELAHRAPPDLVLSDVMMPGLDGFALLRALRDDARTATIPIILLSARAGEEARVEGAQAGADDYLAKPFAAQELVARVAVHLSLARARREATAAIATARDLLTRVLEQAPVGICVLRGTDHVYELANAYYRAFLPAGRPIVGHPVREVVPEAERQGFVGLLDRVRDTGEPWIGRAMEIQYDRSGTGALESAYLNLLYHPFRYGEGDEAGVIAVVSEVTDEVRARRDAEEARADAELARRAAEQASRAKSEFLAIMSHELRTPLNAIGGYAELLQMGIRGPITEAQREDLSRVMRAQRHLLGLINDVLNLARIETGRVEYAIEEFAMDEVVAELEPMIEPLLAAKQLGYTVRVPAPAPSVRADRDKTVQILLNLLSNAVKFTPSGGQIELRVDVASGGRVMIHVADTGVGIPAEKIQSIFEPFVQVRVGPTRSAEGAGLGLAISRDLARGMNGELTAVSSPNVGSTFTLVLPLPLTLPLPLPIPPA